MNKKYIVVSSIFYGIINPCCIGRKRFPETTVNYFGAIVNGIANAQGNVLIVFVSVRNCPNAHNCYIVRYTIYTFTVISLCSDNPGNVGAVAFIFHPVLWVSVSIAQICYVIGIVTDNLTSVKIYIVIIIQLFGEMFEARIQIFIYLGDAVGKSEHLSDYSHISLHCLICGLNR